MSQYNNFSLLEILMEFLLKFLLFLDSHTFFCILSSLFVSRDWWVAIGGYHFSSFISVLVILLMFLAAVLAFLLYILFYLEVDFDGRNSCLGGATAGHGRDSTVAQHRAVLKRIILGKYSFLPA